MSDESGNLHFKQLESSLESFRAARSFPRPERGWIHAIREATGVSTGELGRKLGTSRQLPLQFEKAEADDSITLKSLRRVGDALECDLVYALVPRVSVPPQTSITREPVKKRSTSSSKPVRKAVEAPALEDEAENSYFCD
jgi:predicted DNA-binding mobile mystery protein A